MTYQGFYDENLEWVGLENIHIVASMSAGGRLGRHKLTTRFTSIVRLCAIEYVSQCLIFGGRHICILLKVSIIDISSKCRIYK